MHVNALQVYMHPGLKSQCKVWHAGLRKDDPGLLLTANQSDARRSCTDKGHCLWK